MFNAVTQWNRFKVGWFLAAIMFAAMRTADGEQSSVVEFSITDKHAIAGPNPRTAFFNGYGTLRVKSTSSDTGIAINYYCGETSKPSIQAVETSAEITFVSLGSLCGYSIPDGAKVSPIPRLLFDDQDATYQVFFGGISHSLRVISIRVDGNEGRKEVVGYAMLGSDFAHRVTFQVSEFADETLAVYIRVYHCGHVIIDDAFGALPEQESAELVFLNEAGFLPLLIGKLHWQTDIPSDSSCGK